MSIVLSCGHVVSNLIEGHNASVAAFDGAGNKCVRHMVLCGNCLELERNYDNLLCSDEDVLMWLED